MKKELWIIDRFGYAIDKTDGVTHKTREGDFMYPHEYFLSVTGVEYYPCHGYNVVAVDDIVRRNCAVAMGYGANCQCGQH